MFLVLSGEGQTDIGVNNEEIGPLTMLTDQLISDYLNYSLVATEQFFIEQKSELVKKAKSLKPLTKRGKKQGQETRYFYKNARALAEIAKEKYAQHEHIILILFRDADGSQSAGRGHWQDKWNSMLNGFQAGGMTTGVPMLAMPKSEAWILCALRQQYQDCAKLEKESGSDNSPNSLKSQLTSYLGEEATRDLLNDKVNDGEIDFRQIDMPSMEKFKSRLQDVLENYGL